MGNVINVCVLIKSAKPHRVCRTALGAARLDTHTDVRVERTHTRTHAYMWTESQTLTHTHMGSTVKHDDATTT